MTGSLGARLAPCGPVVDAVAADRVRERLSGAASEGGWSNAFEAAWPALAPVFAASPYLGGLARRWPERLRLTLEAAPEDRLAVILSATTALSGGADEVRAPLRRLKAELHLLTALADLGGVWDLDAVTGALSRFADVSTQAALRAVAHDQRERGKLVCAPDDPRGPIPGLFAPLSSTIPPTSTSACSGSRRRWRAPWPRASSHRNSATAPPMPWRR